jgi:hypothetical protein
MMIDRRAFVAGTALVAVAPACGLLPLDAAANTADAMPVLMIDGWSAQGDGDPDNQIWIKVGHGWRTAWR